MSIAKQKIIGERIAAARQRADVTQKQLAEAVRVSVRHIQEIEAGRTDVKLSVLEGIAQAVGVATFQLLLETGGEQELSSQPLLCPKKFASIFCPVDSIKSAIQIIDREGTVWFVSSSTEQQLGISRSEICGQMKIWDFVDDEDEKKALQTNIRCMLEHQPKPTPFVTSFRRKDGKTVPIMIDWSYLRDSSQEIAGFVSTLSGR